MDLVLVSAPHTLPFPRAGHLDAFNGVTQGGADWFEFFFIVSRNVGCLDPHLHGEDGGGWGERLPPSKRHPGLGPGPRQPSKNSSIGSSIAAAKPIIYSQNLFC